MRILNGDGGSWIKAGIVDPDTHYQLDPFHKNLGITRKVSDKEQKKTIRNSCQRNGLMNYLYT